MRTRFYESTVEHACGKGLRTTAHGCPVTHTSCRARRPLTLQRVADHPEPWIGCKRHRQLCRPDPLIQPGQSDTVVAGKGLNCQSGSALRLADGDRGHDPAAYLPNPVHPGGRASMVTSSWSRVRAHLSTRRGCWFEAQRGVERATCGLQQGLTACQFQRVVAVASIG